MCRLEFNLSIYLIKSSQHGFSSGNKSCLTNLLIYLEVEQVTSEIDKGIPVDTLYIDFAKAFDKVPHYRLIEKIAANGIQSWLTDRKQRVIVNNVPSDWIPVISGVPHGSVLGPCLFVIYINDINDAVSSKILKFADNTKITASISSRGAKYPTNRSNQVDGMVRRMANDV